MSRVPLAPPIGATLGDRRSALGLRWLGLGVSSLAIQIALVQGLATAPAGAAWLPYLLPASHLLLISFLIRNLSFRGIQVILIGLFLNLTVMLANGGLMPIEPSAVRAVGGVELSELHPGDHVPGTKNRLLPASDSRVSFLSDRFVTPGPFGAVVSIGDLFIAAGLLITYAEVVYRHAARGRTPDG